MSELDKIIEKCIGNEMPFCQAACPLHVDMKGANTLIREGKFDEALKLIREKLPFPGILGRICTHPCEDKCKRRDVDEPISIMCLKRSAADYGTADGDDLTIAEEKKERIAVIGGGPAGMMAAYELRKMGYQVTIFEALPVLGGMLAVGIPGYRLPRDILQQELGIIEKMGIEVKLNTRIDGAAKLAKLKQDFDAVFIAVGAQVSGKLSIEGSELEGVLWGVDFLREANLGREVEVKDRVVVIGGGNVAIDVALTALRLGAKEVQLACLESREEMPAFEWEIQQALDEGVKLNVSWGPKRILGDGKGVKGIELVRCTSVFDAEGRFNPSFDQAVTTLIDTDMVIMAIGQAPDTSFLTEDSGVACSKRGYITVNETTLETSLPGVFAGGDVAYGPKSVIEALAAGKKAAISIDRYIRGEDLNVGREDEGPRETNLKVDIEGVSKKKRVSMPALPVEQRKRNFQEIELGLSEEAAKEEAERCLSCECKLCVKDCEFLRHYCQTPKELAEKFKAGYFKENPVIPYSCNLCELCKKHCPEELCVGDMCLEIRERMVEEGIGPLPQHKMIIEDAEWALSPAFALSLPDPATGDCKRAFFTGCNLPAYSPSLVLATYDYLREKLPGTGIILRCCGEPYHGLGLSDPFKEAMAGLEQEMKKLGATELIVPCPECYRTLKRANPSFKLRTLYEVLLEVGIPQPPGDGKAIFSLHDSCTARGEPAFQDSARELIKLTGHEIEELPHSRDLTLCCGQGGLIMPVNPMRVLGLAKDRLAEAHHDVVSYCAACRETFSIHRPSVHVLDLIFNPNWQEDMKRRPNKPSVRKENQAQLKKLLLEKAKKA